MGDDSMMFGSDVTADMAETAGELLELLADDEMIEGGYDREGMVALLLLARAGLQVLCGQIDGLQQELAELRGRLAGAYTVTGHWEADTSVEPDGWAVHIMGRDDTGLTVDVLPVVKEALRRQAREWCRSVSDGEGPALEQLLAMAHRYRLDLIVTHDAAGGCEAGWWSDDMPKEAVASAKAPGLDAAIRAATCELLGVDVPVGGQRLSDGEGPPLEQLLPLVPPELHLYVDRMMPLDLGTYYAGWESGTGPSDTRMVEMDGTGSSREAAIRAATCELLGLPVGGQRLSGSPADLIRAAIDVVDDWAPDYAERTPHEEALVVAVEALRGAAAAEPRQTCSSCQHWQRDDEPATEGGARPCGLDEERDPAPRHPASLCARPGYYQALEHADTDPVPDSDSPPLKGVTQPAANVIRSEGGDDV